ncbi:MAG: WD40/YVTN/BNR-like repeat-containing protein, partial [Actinomycetota bacterium]
MKHTISSILKTRNAARDSRSFLWQALCLAALFFCFAGAGAVHGQTGLGEAWEWRNPLPQGSGLHALAESEGRLIAVGRAGTVLTTTDGMSWTPRVSGTRNWLQAVAASGATVVAVGREGDIVTSTDGGLTWALRSSSAMSWNTVIHGGGVWVAA